jgi:transposase
MSILSSVPGVGKVTAITLIAQMPELGKISNKPIASLLGAAPITKQSCTYKGLATIQGGRLSVRKVMYMAALAAVNFNPKLKEFYKRLKNAGKKSKIALVAVIRKLIVILNVMVKRENRGLPLFLDF